MIYITRRIGIDDVVIGKVTNKIESNDDELTAVAKEIVKLKTYEKKGNKKFVGDLLTNVKNKLYFPFGLTTNAKVDFEIYKDTVYA